MGERPLFGAGGRWFDSGLLYFSMNTPTPSCDAQGTELVPIEFARALERRAIVAEKAIKRLIYLFDQGYDISISDIDHNLIKKLS